MQYASLVEVSRQVATTAKRSEKTERLADLLRTATPGEVPVVVGLLVGEPRQGRMGVGWAALRDRSVTPAQVASLTVSELDDRLSALALLAGEGSQRVRQQQLTALMGLLTEAEQHHLVRLLAGELRQGANEGVVTDAVAKAAAVPATELRRAAMLLGDLGDAAQLALAGDSLAVGLVPLVGVRPMLAGTAATVAEALAVTGPASVEWKLDGARVQVHRSGAEVRVFTRSLREIGARVPELVQATLDIPSDRFVLDGEALGLDAEGNPLKFQDTMNVRTRLQPFFFDVLHMDGQSMIDEPLHARKALLAAVVPSRLRLPTLDTDDAVAAERFGADAIAAGHEGVMVKGLDSPYQAGRRGTAWRKVKPAHTLDLVVLAAEWGHGRRVGWLSNLHLGAQGADGTFVMVGKTFKGLSDEVLRWQTAALQAIALGAPEAGYIQHVRPELVVEVAIDGVQRSVRYPGGVALRFARVRRYRPDKTAAEADSIEAVQTLL